VWRSPGLLEAGAYRRRNERWLSSNDRKLLEAQEHKGYGEDEGERDAALAAGGSSPEAKAEGFDVEDNPHERRYRLSLGREIVGELRYRLEPGVGLLAHTEIEPSLRGRGLATRLVRSALDDIRGKGLKVKPLCPFVRAFIARYPEYDDLIVNVLGESN
jgi:predicted GNAT family acetyltransferase